MNGSEELVDRRLREWGFRPERFSKEEMRRGKTPDRRVYREKELLFFLEVKEVAPDDWLGGERADPRFNRLTSDIHEAVKQFDSVNANREVANVIAFVNRDSMCGSLDLYGVLTGDALTSDGGRLPIYRKHADGRIKTKSSVSTRICGSTSTTRSRSSSMRPIAAIPIGSGWSSTQSVRSWPANRRCTRRRPRRSRAAAGAGERQSVSQTGR